MSTTIPCGPPVGAIVSVCTVRQCNAVRVADELGGVYWETRILTHEERDVIAGVPCPGHRPCIQALCTCGRRLIDNVWEENPPGVMIKRDTTLPMRLCTFCTPTFQYLDRVLGQIMEEQADAEEGCC